jgi:hypothetical protein
MTADKLQQNGNIVKNADCGKYFKQSSEQWR